MNKKLSVFFVLCAILIGVTFSTEAYTVTTVKNVPNNYNYNYNENIYNNDLSHVEQYLFGRRYSSESNSSRLNRIEKELFNQSYSSMNISQRMNNILANYRGEDYPQRYYNNSAYNTSSSNRIKNRLINTFVGQPTGFSPEITNSPYINRFGPSYNRGYYGTNGWGYHNSYNPTFGGAGIHILH